MFPCKPCTNPKFNTEFNKVPLTVTVGVLPDVKFVIVPIVKLAAFNADTLVFKVVILILSVVNLVFNDVIDDVLLVSSVVNLVFNDVIDVVLFVIFVSSVVNLVFNDVIDVVLLVIFVS